MANDVAIFLGISFFFILAGLFVPYLNAGFSDVNLAEYNPNITSDISSDNLPSLLSLGDVITSIWKMFTWSYGSIPLMVEVLLFIPLRLLLLFIIIRWIRGVG